MHRRNFLVGVGSTIASVMAGAGPAHATTQNVVLAHGLFADSSCWSEVILRLRRAGYQTTAAQIPMTTLEASACALRRVLGEIDGPVVLVGHSFAGTVLSEVGDDPKVSALIYVAARAPDAGEDYARLAGAYPRSPASAGIVFDRGQGRLTEVAFLRDFANGIPETQARMLYALQEPFDEALLGGRTTAAAWRSKPSFYAVSADDRSLDPDLQRFMANRMGAEVSEIPAGHLSMVSHPDHVTALITMASAARGWEKFMRIEPLGTAEPLRLPTLSSAT